MVAYSFKKRFVAPIKIGLGIQVHHEPGDTHVYQPKLQTIRAERKRHARAGEELQFYCGMRTKSCFLIGKARCLYTERLTIEVLKTKLVFSYFVFDASAFALADGFVDATDMHAFWLKEHGLGTFEGVLIRWEPLK